MTTTSQDLKAAARELFASIDADQASSMPAPFAEQVVAHLPRMAPLDQAAFQQLGAIPNPAQGPA